MCAPFRALGLLRETKVVRALALRNELLQALLWSRPELERFQSMLDGRVGTGPQQGESVRLLKTP